MQKGALHAVMCSVGSFSWRFGQILNRTWVNIVDLMLSRTLDRPVHQFPSRQALRKYTQRNSETKIFPKEAAKADGFVKELLITLYHD